MSDRSDELLRTLIGELAVHDQLTETARLMNEALKRGDAVAVKRLSGRYDEFTMQVEQLEEKRQDASAALVKTAAIVGRPLNLSTVILAVAPEKRPSFEEVRIQLKRSMGELAKINTCNQILLEEALHAISQTMAIVAKPDTKLSAYRKSGRIAQSDGVRRSFINQTA
jgi:hypothetical protein